VDDQIDTIGKAFLGLTLGCARCHDHKFDPISQSDYYALAGIFYSTRVLSDIGTGDHSVLLRVPLAPAEYVRKRELQLAQPKVLEKEMRVEAARQALATVGFSNSWIARAAAPGASAGQLATPRRPSARSACWPDDWSSGEFGSSKYTILATGTITPA
jgi:hypothetical protein